MSVTCWSLARSSVLIGLLRGSKIRLWKRNSSTIDYKPGREQRHSAEALANKDLLLFRYEAPKKIFRQNAIAIAMFPVWTYLAYFASSLRGGLQPYKARLEEQGKGVPWAMDNVNKAANGVAIGFFLFGGGLSSYWIIRTMNTVRRLVLRKGGKHITIITYGIFGSGTRMTSLPISHCSAVMHRFYGKERFFLRVKDHAFKYQFNVEEGAFTNKPLFDRTVGLRRRV